jgi:hypothetical protein
MRSAGMLGRARPPATAAVPVDLVEDGVDRRAIGHSVQEPEPLRTGPPGAYNKTNCPPVRRCGARSTMTGLQPTSRNRIAVEMPLIPSPTTRTRRSAFSVDLFMLQP